jgi:hypothetical protein
MRDLTGSFCCFSLSCAALSPVPSDPNRPTHHMDEGFRMWLIVPSHPKLIM